MSGEQFALAYIAYILLTYSRFGKKMADRVIYMLAGLFMLFGAIAEIGVTWLALGVAMVLLIGGIPGIKICIPDNKKERMLVENIAVLMLVVMVGSIF